MTFDINKFMDGDSTGALLPDAPKQAASVASISNALSSTIKQRGASQYDDLVNNASNKYAIPSKLIHAVIHQESRGNANAVSKVGALGLMQVMPTTAPELGYTAEDMRDPSKSIDAGSKYLKRLLDRYDGNERYALAAYNAGMGNVDDAIKKSANSNRDFLQYLPKPQETMPYVNNIMAAFNDDDSFQDGRQGRGNLWKQTITDNAGDYKKQAERARLNSERGTAGDIAKAVGIGAVGFGQSIADLGYATTGAEPFNDISKSLNETTENLTNSMSPDMQDAAKKTFVTSSHENTAWSDPLAWTYLLAQTTGSAIPFIFGGEFLGGAAKSVSGVGKLEAFLAPASEVAAKAFAEATAKGAAKEVALSIGKVKAQESFEAAIAKAGLNTNQTMVDIAKNIEHINMAGMTATGMLATGADAASSAMQEWQSMPEEARMKSPQYAQAVKSNLSSGMSDKEAIAAASKSISMLVGSNAAELSIMAAPSNIILGKVMSKLLHGGLGQPTRLGNFAVAAALEIPANAAEEAITQKSSNMAIKEYANQNKDTNEGVAEAGFQGAFGAGAFAAPHLLTTPTPKQANSPLSNAAATGAPPTNPIGYVPSNPNVSPSGETRTPTTPVFDDQKFNQMHTDLANFISNRDNIAALRAKDPSMPEQAFHVWAMINNPEIPLATRINALENAHRAISNLPNFTMGNNQYAPSKDLTTLNNTGVSNAPVAPVDDAIEGDFINHERTINRTPFNHTAVQDNQSFTGREQVPEVNPTTRETKAISFTPEKEIVNLQNESIADVSTRHKQISHMVEKLGYTSIDKDNYLSNPDTGSRTLLTSPASIQYARQAIKKHIDGLANNAATSPTNDLAIPSQEQAEAGEYKKGHLTLHGIDIAIENPKGSVRSGVDASGKSWESTLAHHYGEIKHTNGADGDPVDVFIGNNPTSDSIFVVDQKDPATGQFDEHKVMMGFNSEEEATQAYHDNYDKNWKGHGAVTEMTVPEFKDWLQSDSKVPVSMIDNRPTSEQYKSYDKWIDENSSVPKGMLEQIKADERLEDGESSRLIAKAQEKNAIHYEAILDANAPIRQLVTSIVDPVSNIIAISDIPKSLKIELENVVDGKTVKKLVNARKAMEVANERVVRLEQLLACLG